MSTNDTILEKLKQDPQFSSQVSRWHTLPMREGTYSPIPDDLSHELQGLLSARGITRIYSHQLAAYQAARRGEHVVVVTPTASGKTLSYNLPVVQTLLEHPEMRALYMFPTKALSQDQQSELNEIVLGGALPLKVATYDGDTPQSLRVSARESGRIVISNPDMLHAGVLPNHPKWIKFLSNLRYIVIDEVHTYRGIFGSHMTNLIRRLKRIAEFYGSSPQFILCSATIGNPKELAEQIIEEQVTLVDQNGAPSGEKHVVLYNPPLVDAVQGIRRGVVLEAKNIALSLLRRNIKTIVFARSRLRTELIASYIKKAVKNMYTNNEGLRIESYRGGYLPNERREIEKGLREGRIHGVVSTNALELGIDIGALDAAVLAGMPASIASIWQQAGRAGRRNNVSIAVLIASAAPTDQFLVQHPDYFFGRSPESAWINPDNLYVLIDHLKSAVFELPFSEGDTFGKTLSPEEIEDLLAYLQEAGTLRKSAGRWYWSGKGYPAEEVSLRTTSPRSVVIIDTTGGRNEVIGEMDVPSAKELLFPNAVYLHRDRQYVSLELDIENLKCYIKESQLNYYTDSVVKTDIKVLEIDNSDAYPDCRVLSGDVLVRSQVAKYKKLKFGTHENLGYGDIHLPEEEIHTRAVLMAFEDATRAAAAMEAVNPEIREHVIAHIGTLIRNIAPVFLLCERSDIGIAERIKDPFTEEPTIYIYDTAPGGIGLSEGFAEKRMLILKAASEVLNQCACEYGCPSCIGPDEGKTELNKKRAVIEFFKTWLDEGLTAEHS
ncbi:MAG: DEAD/DEAH box helicase [Spirochaetaceae bacterium]|nr:DEAD/DEAH box helicase [Spirochaetaceae bacterium]MCF7950458.1 DEAD/DEAH box helicase [Spirochaetaceae bacterium]